MLLYTYYLVYLIFACSTTCAQDNILELLGRYEYREENVFLFDHSIQIKTAFIYLYIKTFYFFFIYRYGALKTGRGLSVHRHSDRHIMSQSDIRRRKIVVFYEMVNCSNLKVNHKRPNIFSKNVLSHFVIILRQPNGYYYYVKNRFSFYRNIRKANT